MPQLKFTILASDFEGTEYTNYDDCPITRALKRAGYNAYDGGLDIVISSEDSEREYIETPEYQALVLKVMGMYNSLGHGLRKGGREIPPIPIEDFEVVLDY